MSGLSAKPHAFGGVGAQYYRNGIHVRPVLITALAYNPGFSVDFTVAVPKGRSSRCELYNCWDDVTYRHAEWLAYPDVES